MISQRDNKRTGERALAAHIEECEACRANAVPIARLATLLEASVIEVDAAALSRAVLLRARPELQRMATWAFGRQVAAAVLVALLPLPVVLAFDAYVLHFVYTVASWLLPAPVAEYFVGSYAAFLALLFALTYATVPVLLAHRCAAQEPAHGV